LNVPFLSGSRIYVDFAEVRKEEFIEYGGECDGEDVGDDVFDVEVAAEEGDFGRGARM
jgi:hypothetical protein